MELDAAARPAAPRRRGQEARHGAARHSRRSSGSRRQGARHAGRRPPATTRCGSTRCRRRSRASLKPQADRRSRSRRRRTADGTGSQRRHAAAPPRAQTGAEAVGRTAPTASRPVRSNALTRPQRRPTARQPAWVDPRPAAGRAARHRDAALGLRCPALPAPGRRLEGVRRAAEAAGLVQHRPARPSAARSSTATGVPLAESVAGHDDRRRPDADHAARRGDRQDPRRPAAPRLLRRARQADQEEPRHAPLRLHRPADPLDAGLDA